MERAVNLGVNDQMEMCLNDSSSVSTEQSSQKFTSTSKAKAEFFLSPDSLSLFLINTAEEMREREE